MVTRHPLAATVVMPWRATADRIPAHDRCVDYWTSHGYPVIGADSNNPGKPFNRAQARNNAVTQATTSVVIIADADTLPADHKHIERAVTIAAHHKAVWPYLIYRMLPADAVDVDDLTTVTPIRDYPVKWRPGGLTVITKFAYDQVGGYDETFGSGWGFEDGAFHLACQTLVKTVHIPGVAYAFNHPGSRARDRANRRKYWWYQRASGKPDQMRRLTQRGVDADRHSDPRPTG